MQIFGFWGVGASRNCDFFARGEIDPFRLAASRQATFPKGTAFGGGDKVSGSSAKFPVAPVSPSQALPRQLPQRGSQAVSLDTKVLGTTRKLPGVLLALPLGELAKPLGFD